MVRFIILGAFGAENCIFDEHLTKLDSFSIWIKIRISLSDPSKFLEFEILPPSLFAFSFTNSQKFSKFGVLGPGCFFKLHKICEIFLNFFKIQLNYHSCTQISAKY